MFQGATNAAEFYAENEIRAQKAKENYDEWVKQKASDAAEKSTGLKWEIPGKNKKKEEVVEGMERFTKYQPRKNQWRFDLNSKPALADLKALLALPTLPEFASDVKTNHEIHLDAFATKLQQAMKKQDLKEGVLQHEAGVELKVLSVDYVNSDDVCKAMETNTTISKLTLSNNKIDSDCVAGIAAMLEKTTTLTYLDLSDNDITNEGVSGLKEALKANKTVTTLDLSMINIGLGGSRHIRDVLLENTTLTRLYLNGNDKVGQRGFEVLLEALEKNDTLHVLGLSNTSLGTEAVELLTQLLAENKNSTLAEIPLTGNKFGTMPSKLEGLLEDRGDAYFKQQLQIYIEKQKQWEKDEHDRAAAEKKRKAEEEAKRKAEEEEAKKKKEEEMKAQKEKEEEEQKKKAEEEAKAKAEEEEKLNKEKSEEEKGKEKEAEQDTNAPALPTTTTTTTTTQDKKGTGKPTPLTSLPPTSSSASSPNAAKASSSSSSSASPTTKTKPAGSASSPNALPRIGGAKKAAKPSATSPSKVKAPPKIGAGRPSSAAKPKPLAKRSAPRKK
eukprot:TRINITY_DN61160_c0_g1_i2.p1 TRINITY_DN61160_c0_g1~~TRINITY_DN61160_c0_g1_i2.p1  ORF type:complete len:556 (-),score=128.47 TRINITY_DN61160_c0_g1_i2:43-1710(-)